MAIMCMDSFSIELTACSVNKEIVAPPVENHFGDSIFIPFDVSFINSSRKSTTVAGYNTLLLLAAMLVACLGLIIWFIGGRFMYYVPLYISLLPVVYWLVKIAYAFALSRYSLPDSIIFSSGYEKSGVATAVKIKDGASYLEATLATSKKIEERCSRHE
ncbi:hypothetical protein D8682_01305 [Buttiauxella sp. 3AFRM03]|uniref:hypothetical protein n=1 Tax=Buttiauxella sp. 3AFRM03 TaxID=2479367 RepID=UPI000EF84B70|nr:hypothetical protein [Buttiauxella sp. 3AFRM03]AYN25739.1 hypothetical protein D8682_01305 [Buttiauxella sp. 3AFRM03]